MKFLIVTGVSGAGKTTVLKFLEDINYFCADNLPPALLLKFAELFKQGSEIEKVALGIDIRGERLFEDFFNGLDQLKENGYDYDILFLDASNETLVNRFKETRRSHPLSKTGSIEEGIQKERDALKDVRKKSTHIVDTSSLLTRELREKINSMFVLNEKFDNLIITVSSFGFKYGIPKDSDLVFDVRFLPNPFYISELKELTGDDREVSDYVMSFEESRVFLDKLVDMVSFLIPHYIKEGRNRLVISIGCTGGRHRSVTLANKLDIVLKERKHSVRLKHHDIDKASKGKK